MGRIGRYYVYGPPRARVEIALPVHALYIKPAARTKFPHMAATAGALPAEGAGN